MLQKLYIMENDCIRYINYIMENLFIIGYYYSMDHRFITECCCNRIINKLYIMGCCSIKYISHIIKKLYNMRNSYPLSSYCNTCCNCCYYIRYINYIIEKLYIMGCCIIKCINHIIKKKSCNSEEFKPEKKNKENEFSDNTININKEKNIIQKEEKIEQKEMEKESKYRNDEFYPINQLYGFINNGNNCYLNSSLQLLTRINDLKINIFNYNYENICADAVTKGKLFLEFRKILQDIQNGKHYIDPKKLKKVMGEIDEKYKDNNQEDANEFISNFLDGLLDEIGDKNNLPKPLNVNNKFDKEAYDRFYNRFYKAKGDSFLLDLFYSILKTQKVCKNCNKVFSIKFNAYNLFELPIYDLAKKKYDIKFEDILEKYLEKNENIDGECKYCGKKKIYEKINIYSLSKYVMFYFGRTIDNKYINNQIIYKEKFSLDSSIKNDIEYKLECVIEHSGGAHYGHYTSLCPIDQTDKWYKFSDTSYYEHENKYHGSNAILLLYKRED